MSDDKITEWLLSFSMEELLDLEKKLKQKIRALARERAREEERRKQAAEAERLKAEAQSEAERLKAEARAEAERLKQEAAEEEARRQREAQERDAREQPAPQRPKPLPTNLYASVDQLAASQGLDISGLMSEIAKKTAKKPATGKPVPGKGGNGRR
ncbi:hypothetical protein [Marinobacterium aestuariivivens]|uniref:Translation initiation factor IF-2 n=1 Tax=Marinobacterium aestuariivivens TaxID=1698799 RepID=A0ABW1ZVJ9_9GAMM